MMNTDMVLLFTMIFCVIPVQCCWEAVTVATCFPIVPENVSLSKDSYALGDISGIFKEKPDRNDENNSIIYCESHGQKPVIGFEFFVYHGPPSKLTIEIAKSFVPELEFSSIACSYEDISQDHMFDITADQDTTTSNLIYYCDGVDELEIKLIGIPIPSSMIASITSESGHKVSKRSAVGENLPMDEIKCSDGTYTIEPDRSKEFYLLSQLCSIHDDPYRSEIGRVWMFNSVGEPDCLPCCIDHHWDNSTKKCEKCKDRNIRPRPNIFPTCIHGHKSPGKKEDEDTPMPDVTTLFMPTVVSFSTPFIPTPGQEPEMKPPNLEPRGLELVKRGSSHAVITWDPVLGGDLQPVKKYNVTIVNLARNESRYMPTKQDETQIMLHNLSPAMSYIVNIQAGNPAGFGPRSEGLEFQTLHKLEMPANVKYVIEKQWVIIKWTPSPWEANLKTKVKYWEDDIIPKHVKEDHFKTNGEISFALPRYGIYNVEMFYANEDQFAIFDETESMPVHFKVNYENETDATKGLSPGKTFLIVVGGFLLFIVVLLLIIKAIAVIPVVKIRNQGNLLPK